MTALVIVVGCTGFLIFMILCGIVFTLEEIRDELRARPSPTNGPIVSPWNVRE